MQEHSTHRKAERPTEPETVPRGIRPLAWDTITSGVRMFVRTHSKVPTLSTLAGALSKPGESPIRPVDILEKMYEHARDERPAARVEESALAHIRDARSQLEQYILFRKALDHLRANTRGGPYGTGDLATYMRRYRMRHADPDGVLMYIEHTLGCSPWDTFGLTHGAALREERKREQNKKPR